MIKVETQLRYPTPKIDLNALGAQVLKTVVERYDPNKLRQDLEYLQREGHPMVTIAAKIGTPVRNLYLWSRGSHCPTNTFYIELVHEWAEEVRQKRKEQEEQGLQVACLLS